MKPSISAFYSRTLAVVSVVTFLQVGAAAAAAQEHGMLLFGAGQFNVGGARDPVQVDFEWRSRPKKTYKLQINAGAMVNGDGGAYAFAGLKRDYRIGRNWGVAIGLGAGLWHQGDGLDLGGPLEFRTSFEIFADLSSRSRLALHFYHLSNGNIYAENEGANSIVLLYGLRLKGRAESRP
jgi:hypothetical protein